MGLERSSPERTALRGPKPQHDQSELHPWSMFALQRAAGNRAVSSWLHQQSPNPALPVTIQRGADLTQTKANALAIDLQTAIDGATWKEIRKRVYPKESAAGIARARERKTGKRPDLTGLGSIATLEHFAAAVRAVQIDWAMLKTDERVKRLGAAINQELRTAGVPAFLIVRKAPMEFKGSFSPGLWMFTVSEELVTANILADPDAAELCNTALHEARHAEQAFLAARYSAGVNTKDAAAIVAEQGIPDAIAKEAVKNKFDAKTDPRIADLGQRMYQASITEGAKNEQISADDGLAELKVKRAKAMIALTALTTMPSTSTIADATAARDDVVQQIATVEGLYTLYRNIPYEADAHEVGDAAELAFKGSK